MSLLAHHRGGTFMQKHIIDGIEVELDDDVDPHDVETLGAEPRGEDDIDLDALEAEAREEGA